MQIHRKDSRIPVTNSKAIYPRFLSRRTVTSAFLKMRIYIYEQLNIEIADSLLTGEHFMPEAETTCHFDLARYRMLTVRVWANMMSEKIVDIAAMGVSVPIMMSGCRNEHMIILSTLSTYTLTS